MYLYRKTRSALARRVAVPVNNMAHALENAGQFEQALGLYSGPKAYQGRGRCLFELGRVEEAAAEFRAGSFFEKDLLPILYALEHIEAANRMYRFRATSELVAVAFGQLVRPSHLCIKRDTKHKTGLLIADGGPGDEVRCAAFYREVAAHFDKLTITCDPRLQSILSRSMPDINFVPVRRYRHEELATADLADRQNVTPRLRTILNDEALTLRADISCTVLDAFGEFRQKRSDFLTGRPHLSAEQSLAHKSASFITRARPQIGLAWRSMRLVGNRGRHYLAVEDLTPLASVDADFWLLQINATEEEKDFIRRHVTLREMPELDLKDDFEGQAALISSLDAVISPLTTTAELSGSLGVKTLIAAPHRSVWWRKNEDGSDVWYRNSRIFTGADYPDNKSLVLGIAAEITQSSTRRQYS